MQDDGASSVSTLIRTKAKRVSLAHKKRRRRAGNANGALNELGQEYGRLTVIGTAGRYHSEIRWVCRCLCGQTVSVPGSRLRSRETQSCGCLHKEAVAKANRARRVRDPLVIELVRSHKGTAASIADTLNTMGIPRQDGSRWAKHHIDYLRKTDAI